MHLQNQKSFCHQTALQAQLDGPSGWENLDEKREEMRSFEERLKGIFSGRGQGLEVSIDDVVELLMGNRVKSNLKQML